MNRQMVEEHLEYVRRVVQSCMLTHESSCRCGVLAEDTVEMLERLLEDEDGERVEENDYRHYVP